MKAIKNNNQCFWKMSRSWKVGRMSCIWSDQLELGHKPIIHKSRVLWLWYQIGKIHLVDWGIDSIIQLQLDCTHLVCLSAMKRWLLIWKEGPAPFHINHISERLKRSMARFIPSEFAWQSSQEGLMKWKDAKVQ